MKKVLFLLLPLFLLTTAHAADWLAVEGKLVEADGVTPIEAADVDFKLEVVNANDDCVIYSEEHLDNNMNSSGGFFSLQLGLGTSPLLASPATTFSDTLVGTFGSGCSYSATPTDARKLKIAYSLDDGSTYQQLSTLIEIGSTAYANHAQSLDGKGADQFIQVNNSKAVTQSDLEAVFNSASDVTALRALIDGSSANYMATSPGSAVDMNSQVVSNVASPSAGNDATNKDYVDQNLGTHQLDLTGLTSGKTLSYDGSKWVVSSAGTGDFKSDGTVAMTADIDLGSNDLVNANHLTAVSASLSGGIGVGTGINSGGAIHLTNQNQIEFGDGGDANFVAFKAPSSVGSNVIWTLPNADGAPGEVLSTDGGGVLQWLPALTADGTVPMSSGSQFLLAAQDDGAISPELSFDTDGNTGIYGNGLDNIFIATAGTDRINIGPLNTRIVSGQLLVEPTAGAGAPSLAFDDNPDTGIFEPAGDDLGFSTAGTEKMRILANGNVGIGLTNPSELLEVSGNIKATNLHIGQICDSAGGNCVATGASFASGEQNTASNQGNAGIGIFDNKNANDLEFRNINAASSKIFINLDAPNKNIDLDVVEANIDHDALSNFVANEHIDHSGVSIGTATDSGLAGGGDITASRALSVDISGTTALGANVDDADAILIYDASGSVLKKATRAEVVLSESEVDAYVGNNGYLTSYAETQGLNDVYSHGASVTVGVADVSFDLVGTYDFLVKDGGTVAFIVEDTGRVGIGTNAPNASLDVTGTDAIIVPQGLTAQRPGTPENGMIRYNSDNSKMEAYENGAWTNMIAAAAGEANDGANVGAGTGQIYRDKTGSSINLKTLAAGSTKMLITDNANDITLDIDESMMNSSNIPNMASGGIAATDVQSAINELDSEKLAKSGDSMSGPLSITGSSDQVQMTIKANGIQSIYPHIFELRNSSDTVIGSVRADGTVSNNTDLVTKAHLDSTLSGGVPAGGAANQIQFNNAGSLGGSANFVWDNGNSKLNVTQICDETGNNCKDMSDPNMFGDFLSDGTTALTGNLKLNGHWLSNDGGDEGVYVDAAGYVGIGTTTPGSLLHVAGTGTVNSRIEVTDTGRAIQSFVRNGVYSWDQGVNVDNLGTNDFQIREDGANVRLAIQDSTGNVGIGTDTPGERLHVNGNAIVVGNLTVDGQFRHPASIANAGANIDFMTGNVQHTTLDCQAFNLKNLKDGGSYLFEVKGTTSATCSFNAYSDNGVTSLNVHLPENHGATIATKPTVYAIYVSTNQAYFKVVNYDFKPVPVCPANFSWVGSPGERGSFCFKDDAPTANVAWNGASSACNTAETGSYQCSLQEARRAKTYLGNIPSGMVSDVISVNNLADTSSTNEYQAIVVSTTGIIQSSIPISATTNGALCCK
ncbi:MAG: hypothetical protein KDD33_12655 [Bdellovibrionales bacterium]|nr:hypothetical protein [Bdellovibrionales bacterium]